MENGKVLSVNSMARIEHVEMISKDLNHGFEKFAQHLKQNRTRLKLHIGKKQHDLGI